MPGHASYASASHRHYAGHLPTSLGPPPLPMLYNNHNHVSPHRTAMPAGYYTAPSSSHSAAASLPLPPQQQQPHDSDTVVSLPPTQHRASSGAWSPADDQQLVAARMQGLNWGQVKDTYFPSKTANACRKRHERLMERRGADDWDSRKLQRLAKEYMGMRKEIWSGLAARTGEKWSVVEQKCMSNGLKNLQSAARAASRRHRLEETTSHANTGYDDDSGISGIGLTPVDALDDSYSSSPEPSSVYNFQAQPQSSYAAAVGACSPGGYGGGVLDACSPTARRRRYAAAAHGAGRHSQGSGSPYLDAERLSGAGMGIRAIINRPA